MVEEVKDGSEELRLTEFDKLAQKVKDSMEGKREPAIPLSLERMGYYTSICQRTNYLLGGYTGSAKSTLLDDVFILNVYDWYIKHQNVTKMKLKIFFYSMERNKEFKIARWTLRKMFLDTGVLIPMQRFYARPGFAPLNKTEFEMFMHYKGYIDGMLESGIIDIYEGARNPMGIKKTIDSYAESIGRKEDAGNGKKVYIPDNDNQITLIIKDHIGLYKPEKRDGIPYTTKKQIIDLASSDDQRFRDYYGFSVVNVSQFNREISNPTRLAQADVEPRLEDFAESATTQHDADVIFSLFDPFRYKVKDPLGYDLDRLVDDESNKKYRYLALLKNTYGADGIKVGLAFQPAAGVFRTLPKRKDILPEHYESVIKDTYFREGL